jgi:AbrB family looped-hinge helix DNA binding protein
MTHRVGTKGQVVIPKELREGLGIEPGSRVEFVAERDGVLVRPAGSAGDLTGLLADGPDLLVDLAEERRREREHERA